MSFVCVYMDDFSNKLNNVNAGYIIGSSLINHLMYANDLVLMAPSSMGLSMLLSLCSEYGIEHNITYNSTKGLVTINILGILSQEIYATMMTYLGNIR